MLKQLLKWRINTIQHLLDLYDEEITKDAFGKTIRAKTMGQRIYVNAMKNNDLVFGIGPCWYR